MSVARALKYIAIKGKFYLPVRWLKRHVSGADMRAHTELANLYKSLLPEGSLCFDVGANIGAVSEALLTTGARVVAFEPNPTVIPELQARCRRNAGWSLVEVALGAEADVATLYERESHGQSSLDPDWEGEVVATHHVPVITLDAAIRRFGIPAYCKIDVEGHEEGVFRGLSKVIPLISFEFHLNEANIQKTLACLLRIRSYGPASVNVTLAEGSSFYFQEWLDLDEFISQFPGEFAKSMPGLPYGDIWVKSRAHSSRTQSP
jgi:FkbM family methyltransferase